MDEKEILAQRFEASRGHLGAVAYRMLSSRSEAEDAVQEAWLRLARSECGQVENLTGWLTTVVARICLDMLRARKSRREGPMDADAEAVAAEDDAGQDIADSVGLAMLVVLEALKPAERVAFVLHDMFNLPFEDIAPVIGRTPVAARQLASRARRRVQGASASGEADRARQHEIVAAFLAASREGDFAALLAVLDPEIALHADDAAVQLAKAAGAGAPPLAREVRGAEAVAVLFKGRAQAARLALVDGWPGLVFAPGDVPRVAFDFVIRNGRIAKIEMIADSESLAALELEL